MNGPAEEATDDDTNKININEFIDNLDDLGTSLTNIDATLENISGILTDINNNMTTVAEYFKFLITERALNNHE